MTTPDFFIMQKISTPDEKIVKELKEFVLPSVEEKIISDTIYGDCEETKTKLILLVERMEYIEKLDIFKKYLEEEHKKQSILTVEENGCTFEICKACWYEREKIVKLKKILNEENEKKHKNSCDSIAKMKEIFKCKISLGSEKHDFAGVHKDIETNQLYLLVTCIETILGGGYKPPFAWLRGKIKDTCINSENFDETIKEHQSLTKTFKEAFIEYLDDNLKKEWLDSYFVIEIKRKGAIDQKLVNKKWQGWQEKDENTDKKLEKIAGTIYDMRSGFTHSSQRMFNCDLPVTKREYDFNKKTDILIKVGRDNNDLIKILKETVQQMATKKLINL